jgi:hypothetical protein
VLNSNEYEYPNLGWWHLKEEIASKMTLDSLRWSRKDCDEAARANPDVEGKYRDEGSIYVREMNKREKGVI